MTRQSIWKIIVTFGLLPAFILACNRQQPTPTPQPATSLPAATTLPNTPPPDPATLPPATRHPQPDAPDLQSPNWAPQLIYSSPAVGEEVLLDGAITLRFDQPMDQASVEEAFTITEAANGDAVAGNFEWSRPDTLIFTPTDQLTHKTKYDVRLNDTAFGLNGRELRQSVSLQLETVGYLSVSQVAPAPDATEIDADSTITLIFNRPVVPLVATSQQTDLPQPINITPAVAGTGEWVSTSIYRFVPDQPLDGATTYTVNVDSALTDIAGNPLTPAYRWSFATISPKAIRLEPPNRTENMLPEQPISVTFNMPMDPASIERGFSLSPSAPVSYNWSDDGRVVGISPQNRWGLGQTYQFSIEGATSANGSAELASAVQSSFTVVPLPRVVEVFPAPNRVADRWQRGVTIRFTSPMDIETLEDKISVSPEPERINFFYSPYDFSISLDFPLAPSTEYEVTVPATASDPYGNQLGEAYSWRFTTPPAEPLVALNLPQQISQLTRNSPSQVQLIYRNISQFNAQLYDVGLPVNLISEPYRLQEDGFRPSGEPIKSWESGVESPDDQIGAITLQLADGEPLPTGVYLLQLSAPEIGRDQRYWQNQKSLIVVADVNLTVRQSFEGVHVWATGLADGRPLAGIPLTLYDEQSREVGDAATDRDGLAFFDYQSSRGYLENVIVTSGEAGQSNFGVAASQWDTGASPWQLGVPADWGEEQPIFAYIYTDRALYRPGDTVNFRGILRQPNYGRYNLPRQSEVKVGLAFLYEYDPDQPFETVAVDQNGNFSGSFDIPADGQLGPYRLFIESDYGGFDQLVTVAEYRKPEFLVQASSDATQTLRGESAQVTINAEYLFGGSAEGLTINYDIFQRAYAPPLGGRYNFLFEDLAIYREGPIFFDEGFFGEPIASGEGKTDANGAFVVDLPASLLDGLDAGSIELTVEATVLDLNNQAVATNASVIFHSAEAYVGVTPENYVGTVGQPAAVQLVTVDWDGERVANQQVEVVFYRREWVAERLTEFGRSYTQWQPDDSEVARSVGITNENGEAVASFSPEIGGTFVAVATVTDGGGRTSQSSTTFWVADRDFIGWRIDPRDNKMELVADKDEYQVGDIARVLAQSPFEGEVMKWSMVERGELLSQQVGVLNAASDVLEIPILPEYAPNAYLTLVAVKGVDETNEYAGIRLGIVNLNVSTEQLTLNVEITPRQTVFQPGEEATFDIKVTGFAKQPISADLSVALVDLALHSLKEDSAPPILEAFYHQQPYRSRIGSGLFISGEGLEVEIPEQEGGFGGGGGGLDSAEESLAVPQAAAADGDDAAFGRNEQASSGIAEAEVRGDFRDTAYWQAIVSTDREGKAVVTVPLPDNLTTWRLTSRAISADSLVGDAEVDIVTTKPLLLRPATPRFFVAGDQLQLGVIVNNNSPDALDVAVGLEAAGLDVAGEVEQAVAVPANSQQLVQWDVTVQDVRFVDLTFWAEGGGYSDATKPTFGIAPDQLIPVYRYNAEDIVGTSGIVPDGTEVEAILLPPSVDVDAGTVETRVTASLAGAILDALDAIEYEIYPWQVSCPYILANELLPNVVTARALRQLNVENADLSARLDSLVDTRLSRLEQLQKGDGGWGWCGSEQSDPYFSAYVLLGLDKAQEAGYAVDSGVLEAAIGFVTGELEDAGKLRQNYEANRQAFYLYVLAEFGEPVDDELEALFAEQRDFLAPYAKGLLASSFSLLQNRSDTVGVLMTELNNSVVLSATGAHWEDGDRDWFNLSSDVRGTAMILGAFSRIDPDSALAANGVRWLMSARTAGHWRTGQEDAWVLMSLTDWMVASGELEADFGYAIGVNGSVEQEGNFNAGNVAEVETLRIPVSELNVNEANIFAFGKTGGEGQLYYTAHLDSFISADAVGAVDRGFSVQRAYFDADCDRQQEDCQPLTAIQAGQQVRVELTIIVPNNHTYAVVTDYLPAGAEAVDPGLRTSPSSQPGIQPADAGNRYGYWGWWYFNRIEFRDERVVFYSDFLPAGTYQYSYNLQAMTPGRYQVMPAIAKETFFPEVFGRSDGTVFEITE